VERTEIAGSLFGRDDVASSHRESRISGGIVERRTGERREKSPACRQEQANRREIERGAASNGLARKADRKLDQKGLLGKTGGRGKEIESEKIVLSEAKG